MLLASDKVSILPQEVLKQAADLLQVPAEQRDHLFERLQQISVQFDLDRLILSSSGRPKEQKVRIAALKSAFIKTANMLDGLSPETAAAIFGVAMLRRSRSAKCLDSVALAKMLRSWAQASEQLLQNYEAPRGRAVDFALERGVRALLPIIEGLFEAPVRIKWNKHTTATPEPASVGAKVLLLIMSERAEPPTTTATLNMVQKTRGRSREPRKPTHVAFGRAVSRDAPEQEGLGGD
jgi:hypothetical protein